MTEVAIRLHPEAEFEARRARPWYSARNPRAADAFLVELDFAMFRIANGPHRHPSIYDRYRRCTMQKFPFSVVYVVHPSFVEVLAIAHHRRRPGYWLDRA